MDIQRLRLRPWENAEYILLIDVGEAPLGDSIKLIAYATGLQPLLDIRTGYTVIEGTEEAESFRAVHGEIADQIVECVARRRDGDDGIWYHHEDYGNHPEIIVGIYFNRRPSSEAIEVIRARAEEFARNYCDPFTVNEVKLVRQKVVATFEEVR